MKKKIRKRRRRRGRETDKKGSFHFHSLRKRMGLVYEEQVTPSAVSGNILFIDTFNDLGHSLDNRKKD